jgi:NAD(P)-dependent dehydrogenase (short-subunit alcohol dehydrogenase family)
MSGSLQRVAVVTGAGRGLGQAIAVALAEAGLTVVVAGRGPAALARVVADGTSRGLAMQAHEVDVTEAASVVRLMADVGHQHGRLDVLINNAGVAIDRDRPAHLADMERVTATLDTNLQGPWRCVTAAIPEMRRNGYGRIVNVSSHMGTMAHAGAGSAAYRVSKSALHMLTRVLADELREVNVLVNAASPGKVDTRLAYGKATQSPQQAVGTFVWLATLPDDGPTGGLFHDHRPLPW